MNSTPLGNSINKYVPGGMLYVTNKENEQFPLLCSSRVTNFKCLIEHVSLIGFKSDALFFRFGFHSWILHQSPLVEMYYNKKFVLNIFIFGVIICKVIPTPVENSTDFLRSSDVANDTDSEEINQRSTPKGNYSFRKQAAFHKGIFPTSSPIYINQTGEEHTDAEAIHVSSPMTAHNHPPNKIEIVTRHYRKSSTQYVDRANRGKIGSPQESKLQGEHSASTDIMNTGAQVTESDSNIVTKLMEAQSSFSNFREDAIKPTDFSTDGLASSTNSTNGTITRILPDQHEESQGNSNSTDTPRLEHDVLATGTEEYIPIHKYRHVKNHTIEYIPLHKYRNTKNRHHLHHLNLGAIFLKSSCSFITCRGAFDFIIYEKFTQLIFNNYRMYLTLWISEHMCANVKKNTI